MAREFYWPFCPLPLPSVMWRLLGLLLIPLVINASDGPYVFYEQNGFKVLNIENERVDSRLLTSSKFKGMLAGKEHHYNLDVPTSIRSTFDNVDKWLAVSDIHGQYHLFRQLLLRAGVINENNQWAFGNGHLVITGDIYDRGPTVTESLWLVYSLTRPALQAGGRVHYLLGNHELMMIDGRKRYLHPRYHKALQLSKMPLKKFYGPGSFFGRQLRRQNTIIRLNDTLFLHGGLGPEVVKKRLSLFSINHEMRQPGNSRLKRFLSSSYGPLWYRGYFRKSRRYNMISEGWLNLLFMHFKASRIVVGHTTMKQISAFYDKRIIAIDAGIKRGKRGEALLFKQGTHYRVATDQSTERLF